ncbi:putative baseplate assembly protein [Brevibacillus sp. 179-C9.3 HS]|uniref:putative baseplate assembly protein n=1 Tax=unclassified Brevibacillus TaxID=2684853 RepID=UPI0039A2255A
MKQPLVDPRDKQAVIRKLREMVPFYTPEWRFTPDDPDPGTALFLLFADMLMNNRERLNQVPHRNFIAFLNMLGVGMAQARPAETFLTFELSTGVPKPVWIPAGTKVSGQSDEGHEVVFETDQPILATPSLPTDLLFSNGSRDFLTDVTSWLGGNAPLPLLDCEALPNHQEHCWYLGHKDLFCLGDRASVQLTMVSDQERYLESLLTEKLANPELVEWAYWSAEEWMMFDNIEADQNRLRLEKKQLKKWEHSEVQGIENRWLRCRVKPGMIHEWMDKGGNLSLTRIQVKTDYLPSADPAGLTPDMLFSNDVQVSGSGYLAFGEQLAPYGMFFLSCEEALTKPGSTVELRFRKKIVPYAATHQVEPEPKWKWIMKESAFDPPATTPVTVSKVVWEYWNGSGWMVLLSGEEREKLFAGSDSEEVVVVFTCPDDLQPTTVQSQPGYWIRVRILQVEGLYGPNPVYMAPWLEDIRLSYSYREPMHEPEASLTHNDLDWQQPIITGNQASFQPFLQTECQHPAVYFGFEQPPLQGPLSFYFSFLPMEASQASAPVVQWEYVRGGIGTISWAKLQTIDQTAGYTESGTVRFAGPFDMEKSNMFNRERYWIRAVNVDNRLGGRATDALYPVLNGFSPNTVRAVQQETIRNEMADRISEGPQAEYRLIRHPVIWEEVWVDETGFFLSSERKSWLSNPENRVDIVYDSDGNEHKCWVLWKRVGHLHDSGPDDRHYCLESATGKILFGDGRHGRELPQTGLGSVRVTYKVGGGKAGNLPAGKLNRLEQSIPFVQAVSNPVAAIGGSDRESLAEALQRGPQTIKHRSRAVTEEDFEWLVREAHPGIAKVKCLPNRNSLLQREAGHVTVIVLPAAGSFGTHFLELRRSVTNYLLTHAAATVASLERIHVVEPVYLEIAVTAELVVGSLEEIVEVELATLDKLARFLDPISGNLHGGGWEIGQRVHPSLLFALLKSVKGVRFVDHLTLAVFRTENGQKREVLASEFETIIHGIVTEGAHRISVRVH